jgi:predicted transcriptional regulator
MKTTAVQWLVDQLEKYGYGCEAEIDAYFRGAKWAMSIIRHKNTH